MIVSIVSFMILGLVAGLIARFLVPGRDPMGLIGTIILGMAGSVIGGLGNAYFIEGSTELTLSTSGIIGSILGAIVLLILMRLIGRRRD